ncbi:glycosyltransferase [Priestia megaterium]|uniref:glycosyltransferase n=1 Tax=Priestia megaterium TaxID=1404 RepID=UPI00203EE158|nr:glycosyltransferase [Priestia megaterium]MCM3544954.1 glycosyltransferase [Priestia megaterium]
MKILHIMANLAPRYGGPSQAIVGMTESLSNLSHEVTIFTTNQDGDGVLDVSTKEPIQRNGVTIRYFSIQTPRFFGTSFPMLRELKREIRKFDIVHIHSLYLFHGAVAAYYCRKYNIPYIVRPHGTLDPFLYKRHRGRKAILEFLFENKNLNHAAALHYTTEEEWELAKEFINNPNGFVVPNGINLENYYSPKSLDEFYDKYPEIKGKKVVLFFSRLNFKKGLDLLIDSFTQVAKQKEDVHLMIVGPDNEGYGAQVKGWIKENNIDNKVTFTGMLTGEEKLQALSVAEMFVLPSYSENFGISVIEAMIMGLPVIISNKVNIYRELLKCDAGEVVNCNSEELTRSILKLLDDTTYAQKLASNGEKMVKEYYQWSEVGKSLEKNYKSIVNV